MIFQSQKKKEIYHSLVTMMICDFKSKEKLKDKFVRYMIEMNLFWKESVIEYDGHIQTEIYRTLNGDYELVIQWKKSKFVKKIYRY